MSTPTTTIPGIPQPVSRAVLGTMTFGDTVDRATAERMIHAALDAGVTLVDTANGYAGGQTETMLGTLLPPGDGVALATKAGIPHPDAGEHSPLSAEGMRRSLEGSLRRLRRERVELFHLHQPDRSVPLAETLEQIATFLEQGRILAWGVSNFSAWQIADLEAAADRAGLPRPVVAQQLYNLLARRIETEYAEFAQVHGLHTMVYNPLGGGLLTGRHRFEESGGSGRFGDSRLSGMYRDRYWNPQLFSAIDELSRIAAEAGMALTELSLRWLVSQEVTSSVLLGGSKVEHLAANLAHLDRGPLPADVLERTRAVGEQLHGPMPAYHR
ncbi:aldo/keto reductase [Brachybacterium phenoliresistens]|uniref:Aldo/keto reductase n=1 Tax=Brachybacterium phenoliresistens TaxID=396014 RepID=Z9JQJ9_9MICO|nr:aldo/keto reductase [Brachybacterium phenoliresistens]EWS80464.1 aldo/keto reductase [Brachybacterium phenoliresistens]